MKDEALNPADRITIEGEGRDEWGHRFFKFAIRGSDRNVAPFSARRSWTSPTLCSGNSLTLEPIFFSKQREINSFVGSMSSNPNRTNSG